MPNPDPNHFYQRTRGARKIMVLDLGFLGDTVHLLPALWMVRQAYPQAELHVTVAAHITSLLDCVPWVNRVWGYMRYPRHATLRENLDMVARLRREKFDAIINLNGSDRSSWLTFLSGAPERLGRVPDDGGPLFWRRMFTAHVAHPFTEEPVYQQRCRCLEKAGLPAMKPEFHAEVKPADLQAAALSEADRGRYFHISPFTTADIKELPPAQLVELIGALRKSFPGQRLALSCAPTPREKDKMEQLLALLPEKPWRVFAGDLTLTQLAAVIQSSALHFSGDTGPFHLAVMMNTPAVAWFWPNPGLKQWLPNSGPYRVVIGTQDPGAQYLGKIATAELVASAQTILKSAPNKLESPDS